MGDMNFPEQGPGPNPFSPEGEPHPNGLRVRAENPDLLFQAIQQRKSGVIGTHHFSRPLEKAEVEMISQGDKFDLKIKIGTYVLSPGLSSMMELVKQHLISSSIQPAQEKSSCYIIAAPNGTKMIVNTDNPLNEIAITTGEGVGYGFSPGETRLLSSPAATRENFDRVMEDFGFTIQEAVKAAYKASGQTEPDEEFVLHPPKMNGINGYDRRGGFSPATTPQELLGKLEIENPNVLFEDIGGQPEAKREIQGLAFALKNPELYRKWGTKPPKGIILYGPPGTGKTLMAKALASQADARFFHVEASDIGSKYYGESEQIVKSIFELAGQTEENTIIFFDEIDAIAPQREGSHEATHRVVSTLLENMDGLAARDNVMVVASTNRLDSIEPALIRAGRFDRWVEVPLPDEEGRKQVFGIHMRKAEEVAGRSLFTGVNLDAIIPKTEKSSGADIAEIIRRVLEEKVRQEGIGQLPGLVTTEEILKEIKGYERIRETKRSIGFSPPQNKER